MSVSSFVCPQNPFNLQPSFKLKLEIQMILILDIFTGCVKTFDYCVTQWYLNFKMSP